MENGDEYLQSPFKPIENDTNLKKRTPEHSYNFDPKTIQEPILETFHLN